MKKLSQLKANQNSLKIQLKEHTGRIQPPETIGKIVRYSCNGRPHHPHFADELTWSKDPKVISEIGRITHYQVIR